MSSLLPARYGNLTHRMTPKLATTSSNTSATSSSSFHHRHLQQTTPTTASHCGHYSNHIPAAPRSRSLISLQLPLLSLYIDVSQSIIDHASVMTPPRCLCDATFGTITSLRNHAIQHGHSFECECGAFFHTDDLLKDHQQNDLELCDATSSKELQVDISRKKIPGRVYCGICRNAHYSTSAQRVKHLVSMHNACPTCLQVFPSLVDCMKHQANAKHCYCSDHKMPFPCLEDLVQHVCADSHNKGIFCHVEIEGDEEARLLEPTYAEGQVAQIERSNLWCKDCDRRFVTVKGYWCHKNSSRHETKALELGCSCGKTFNYLSALVAHLEGGGCRSSNMTRDKLNGIVYSHDKDRRMTKPEYADRFPTSTIAGSSRASIAPDDSASMLDMNFDRLSISDSHASEIRDRASTVRSGVFLTPDGSEFTTTDDNDFFATPSASNKSSNSSDTVFITTPTASTGNLTPTTGSLVGTGTLTPSASSDSDDGVMITPPGSSVNGASDEWAFVNPTPGATSIDGSSVETIKYDVLSKSWSCSKCECSFKAVEGLRQHMASATHAISIFNSPTDVFGGSDTLTSKRDFKTVSGLLQSVECQARKGDTSGMKTIMEIMEKPIDKKFKATMRLLE